MKKTLLALAALLALGIGAAAQDTLLLTGPKGNYHYNSWTIHAGDTIMWSGLTGNCAYYHYTDDTLLIYGIAASLEPAEVYTGPGAAEMYADTTLEKVNAVLRMYKHTSSHTVHRICEDLEVWLKEPPTYYMMMDVAVDVGLNVNIPCVIRPVYPVYERYYSEPVMVTDSFYVGFDQQITYTATGLYETRKVTTNHFNRQGENYLNTPVLFYPMGFWTGSPLGWDYRRLHYGRPYLFPILTPLPDTTVMACDTLQVNGDTVIVRDTLIVGGGTMVVNGDTIVYYDTIVHYDTIIYGLGLQENTLLGRLTGVMPNPATEMAKVVSSFGLTMVEAFNMAGEKVHTLRLPDAPLTATLDVSHWPSGTYLLRIHTPQGTAVKKLVVN